ncbi:hypothetical protein DV515_00014616, partial [Chloebia gouldiae]
PLVSLSPCPHRSHPFGGAAAAGAARAVAAGAGTGLALPPRQDLPVLGPAAALGRGRGRLRGDTRAPGLCHQRRGAGEAGDTPGHGHSCPVLLCPLLPEQRLPGH